MHCPSATRSSVVSRWAGERHRSRVLNRFGGNGGPGRACGAGLYPAADWQSAWLRQPRTADFAGVVSQVWLRLCCSVGQGRKPTPHTGNTRAPAPLPIVLTARRRSNGFSSTSVGRRPMPDSLPSCAPVVYRRNRRVSNVSNPPHNLPERRLGNYPRNPSRASSCRARHAGPNCWSKSQDASSDTSSRRRSGRSTRSGSILWSRIRPSTRENTLSGAQFPFSRRSAMR